VTSDNFRDRTFPLQAGAGYVMGRSSTCDITIRDPALSRRHIEVRATKDGVAVTDLGSSNGCRVNDARVSEALCGVGDTIRLGETELVIDEFSTGVSLTAELPQARVTDLLSRLPSCSGCNVLVPKIDVQKGLARVSGDKVSCARCDDAHLGRLLGGFRILAPLGEGAMGAVYRAEQVSLGRIVALKMLLKCFTADEAAVQRFLREARVGGRCDHPGIVQVIDAGLHEGIYFLALEFVAGQNLAERQQPQGRLLLEDVLKVGAEVTAAMSHAHARGVIHRDIKPGNILWSTAGEVKVTDLGLAKSFEESGLSQLTMAGTTMGTLTYMPPEQLSDARLADARSDIYSTGATLFHLLTGQRPFPGRTPRDYAEQIRTSPIHWPPNAAGIDIPRELHGAIERAMAKSPEARFQTMEAFRDALQRCR